MPAVSRIILPVALFLAVTPALASGTADIAREFRLPVPVVETALTEIDTFFAQPDGPANRLASGQVKELTLKALRTRMSSLEDSLPGRATDASAEEKHATYRVVVRVTRHETTEARDCVDHQVTVTVSEELPAIKDGAFTFDSLHPRLSSRSWPLGFCRSPVAGGGWSDWVPAAGR